MAPAIKKLLPPGATMAIIMAKQNKMSVTLRWSELHIASNSARMVSTTPHSSSTRRKKNEVNTLK
eukprot:CAMPEP_0202723010 /NCGR_PEP_ID=MMETSP1385-20130828/162250_1 /ASSEMBLY_ACC=CAM_ASM_000861 /TAXON_ID=933848 /ORGANISM="Elphidium margaritaceum" /LENGTH=64 /DNA_ID=CAMNT_0049387945 /DNA_START=169 /DNA_END=360 /DNA_ORIENTATION=-